MRIRPSALARQLVWASAILLAGGCATPGPLHLYSIWRSNPAAVHDSGGNESKEAPSFISPDERVTGFAYDPFTDHFFLRLAPGDRMRVVDRPARAVKREFKIEHDAAAGDGDLAIKPSNGHVYLIAPGESRILEITRLGKAVRVITLEHSPTPLRGIAYDPTRDVLWVSHGNPATQITGYHLSGRAARRIVVTREITGPLAFDPDRREFYAPLADRTGLSGELGVFDENGALMRTLASASDHIDVGPRSLVRVF